jgi:parallel beta-helix repeat protein
VKQVPFIKLVIYVGGFLLLISPLHATEWFISPAGNDANAGTSEGAPFQSLQKADSVVEPGDTITVLDGTYPVGAITKSGKPEAWITVRAKNRRVPVFSLAESARLDPGHAYMAEYNGFSLVNVAYVKLIGLSVQGWNPDHHAVDSGHGICIQSSHHILIKDCRVSDCSGAGIGGSPEHWIGNQRIKGPEDFITIEDNEVSGCAFWCKYDTSGISLWVATSAGLGADPSGYNMIVRRNISHGNANRIAADGKPVEAATDGNGIIIDYFQDYPYNTLVEGNLVYDNGGRGITSTHSSNLTFRYNTCWHDCINPLGVGSGGPWDTGELEADDGNNILMEDNIAVANDKAWSKSLLVASKSAVLKNNLFMGPCRVDKEVKLTESGTISGDPKFIRPSADPAVADFRLQARSPALGAGNGTPPSPDLAGTVRASGTAGDLGAIQGGGK